MNQYYLLRQRQQEEYNNFTQFFAFSEQQFAEGMKSLGLKVKDTDKITSIGYGGYIRKCDKEKYIAMMKRHKEEMERAISSDKTGTKFIKDMFSYELDNHEYSYTGDIEDTLNALGLTYEQVMRNKALSQGLRLAMRSCK